VTIFVERSGLRDLYDKVAAGERISEAEALRLFESRDLNALGAIADVARSRREGTSRRRLARLILHSAKETHTCKDDCDDHPRDYCIVFHTTYL